MTEQTALPHREALHSSRRVYAVLLVGIIAVSMAAIFIRFAQIEGVPSLVISGGRLLISTLVLMPLVFTRYRDEIRSLTRSDWLLASLSGIFLAAHFTLWITSLEFSTVLISGVFVATGPLWVALLEFFLFRVRLNRIVIGGLALAVVGSIVIGVGETGSGGGTQPLLGAGLATGGAIALAGYLLCGRKLRAKLPLWPYVWLVYGCAAIMLCIAILVSQTPVAGYSANGYLWVLMTALVPQLIGHTSFNYALRYVSATYVSIATQLEPIGSAVAAMVIFRQVPTLVQTLGSLVILVGVSLATIGQRTSGDQEPARSKPR
jgi:drug/metabolite transporter (DMT)-like permease